MPTAPGKVSKLFQTSKRINVLAFRRPKGSREISYFRPYFGRPCADEIFPLNVLELFFHVHLAFRKCPHPAARKSLIVRMFGRVERKTVDKKRKTPYCAGKRRCYAVRPFPKIPSDRGHAPCDSRLRNRSSWPIYVDAKAACCSTGTCSRCSARSRRTC